MFDDDTYDEYDEADMPGPGQEPLSLPPLFERPYVIELMTRIATWEQEHPEQVELEQRALQREQARRQRRRSRARKFPQAS